MLYNEGMSNFFLRLAFLALFGISFSLNAWAMLCCAESAAPVGHHDISQEKGHRHHENFPQNSQTQIKHTASCQNCCALFCDGPLYTHQSLMVFSYVYSTDLILADPLFYPIDEPPKKV